MTGARLRAVVARPLALACLVWLPLAAGCGKSGAGNAAGLSARLVEVVGAVTVNGQVAATNRELATGDTIRTPLGAAARVQYGDGSRFLLLGRTSEGSELTIAPSVAEGGVTVALFKLTRGLLAFFVHPAGKEKARYEIEATSSLTVVRGTEGKVATGADADVIALRSGTVEVISKPTRESTALAAGNQVSVTRAGSVRTSPYDLSEASEQQLYQAGQINMRSFDR